MMLLIRSKEVRDPPQMRVAKVQKEAGVAY